VPAGNEVVSNGKLLSRKEDTGSKTVTFDWRQDKPHPSYLVTLVVGKFDVVQEEWEGIPVLYYVAPGRKPEVQPTFARTRDMLSYFSKQFGVRYPWDKYAQVMCYQFGGGMENTSATTMGDRILLDERTLLDRNSDSIISHELAHQWWGDMLTCRDWSHLWLNEGFASYAEALWDEHHKGKDDYDYNMFQKAHGQRGGGQGGAIQGGKTRPVMDRHYTSPGAMFDARSYPKGAWVLHMLRHELGDEAFWKGIKQYATEHQLHSVETGDFRRSMEKATGRDLERFFYDWVERPGNPDLEVTTEYLPDDRQAKIVVKQTQAGEAYHFPLKVVLHTAGSAAPTVLEQQMTEKEVTLRIPLADSLIRVDVDPDQAVLSDIKETKPANLWRSQLLEGPNVPARIRAAQHFGQSKTDEDRDLLAKAFNGEKFWAVQVELANALGAAGGNLSRDALIQGLHSQDARVRRACIDGLGKFPEDASVAKIIKETMQKGDPSYAVEGASLSAYAHLKQKDAAAMITPFLSKPSHEDVLASAALSALGATQDPATLDTLLNWTQPGKPRNCRTAALRALTEVAKNKNLTDAQKQQILKPLTEALERDDRFLRFTILNSLPNLGPLAASTLPAVDKLVAEAPDGRVKEMAKGVADKIRAQAPAGSGTTSGELSQLREEIKKLQREQENLRLKLEKFDKAEPQPKK
jgi:aminopeptidase N